MSTSCKRHQLAFSFCTVQVSDVLNAIFHPRFWVLSLCETEESIMIAGSEAHL